MSKSEHSEIGLLQSSEKSSEDSDSEHEIQQRKNNKNACKKRKRMKKVVSDSADSSDAVGTEQDIRASKKRREKNSDQTPDRSKIKTHIPSDDETEEKSPIRGNGISDIKAEKSDSDDSSSAMEEKLVKNGKEKENGGKKQQITEDEVDLPSVSCSPPSNCSEEKSGSKQKLIVQHYSDSSDGTSDTDEKNKSLSQRKKLQTDGNSSSGSSTLPGVSETAETEKLKSYRKEVKNKAEKKTVRKESSSSLDQSLSKYPDSKQIPTKKDVEHASFSTSDSASDTDGKKKSLSPKKQSQSDSNSSSESSTPSGTYTKKEKGKSDLKKLKNKTQKDPGNSTKTNPKIEKLKKYLRVAGLHVRSYQKLWEGCKSNKAKIEKLLQMLNDAGLKGRPTLQKCKRLQAKRERKEEVASLDVGNIIAASEKGRPKRNTPSLYLSRHIMDAEENSPKEKGGNTFSRIKNIVDSEESE